MNLKNIREQLDLFYQQQRFDLAHQLLLENIEQARIHEDRSLELGLLNDLLGYYRVTAHEPRGYAVARQILKLIEPLSESLDITIAHQNLATFYSAFDNLEDANTHYLLCAAYYQKHPEVSLEILSSFYNNFSLFLLKRKQYPQAIDFQEKAIMLLHKIPDSSVELATSLANLAGMYESINKYQAHQNYQQSLAIFEEQDTNDPHYMSALINAGVFYQRNHANSLSLTCYQKAYPLTQQYNTSYSSQLKDRIDSLTRQTSLPKGMLLAQKFYQEVFFPKLQKELPEAIPYISVGLVGKGSECFGFDDHFSWDHDVSFDLCIFVDEEHADLRHSLETFYQSLPEVYQGIKRSDVDHLNRGIIDSETFFKNHLKIIPQTQLDWLSLNENALATCTNGQLFIQNASKFTSLRQSLMNYYPQEVWIKKIAGCCARLSQSGQYNYPRAMRRNDLFAAQLALNAFIDEAIALVYLLEKVYRPFYKWSMHLAHSFTTTQPMVAIIKDLLLHNPNPVHWNDHPFPHEINNEDPLIHSIEQLCQLFANALVEKHLIEDNNPFLQQHLKALITHIKDHEIAERHILED